MMDIKFSFAVAMLSLAACVDAGPLALSGENPGSPRARPGYSDVPAAFSDYKTPADFASRASAAAIAPSGEMQGMHHHDMGMPHGGAPHGAGGHDE